ncbi:MAG: PDZ domain-containing protein [Chitinophagaceae bacterium]|nr:PDZ domain-containing protein [Chitinophagaceae bacterium]
MKQFLKPASLILAALLVVGGVNAQDEKLKEKKKNKEDVQQIIITKTGEKNEKIVVEIDGDKVTINGKDVNDMKDEDIKVITNKFKGTTGLSIASGGGDWKMNWNQDHPFALSTTMGNRAMLGVTTESTDDGVEIMSVTDKSGAEKAGLKEGDLILKVEDEKIESPDDLTKAIRSHKPGDKVKVTYKRDKKELTTTAELGKLEGVTGVYNFNATMPEMRELEALRGLEIPRGQAFSIPRVDRFDNFNFPYFDEEMRLGLSVQDTEDGKGVKVLEVDEESNAAKAGIAVDDVITEFAGKAVNSADEVAKLYREKLKAKEATVPVKLLRGGKEKSLEIKVPRKLKTADL